MLDAKAFDVSFERIPPVECFVRSKTSTRGSMIAQSSSSRLDA
jgi:hypothetical protein